MDTLKQIEKKIDQLEVLLGTLYRKNETENRKYDSEDHVKLEDQLSERLAALQSQYTNEIQKRRQEMHLKLAEDCKPALAKAALAIAEIAEGTFDLEPLREPFESIYTCPKVEEFDTQNEKRRKTSRYAIAATIQQWDCPKVMLLVAMESNWARLPKYKIGYFRESTPEPSTPCLFALLGMLETWAKKKPLSDCPVFLERLRELRQNLPNSRSTTAMSSLPSLDMYRPPDHDTRFDLLNTSINQQFHDMPAHIHPEKHVQLSPPFNNHHQPQQMTSPSRRKIVDVTSDEFYAFSNATISLVPSISEVLFDALRNGTRNERREGNLSSKLVTVVIAQDEKEYSGVIIRIDRRYAFEIREQLGMREQHAFHAKNMLPI